MRKSITIATLISLTASMSLARPVGHAGKSVSDQFPGPNEL
ncbi:hypothetical protein [Abiotrophia sp.]|nr:hypothetical protein [Abiotrophia sp.]